MHQGAAGKLQELRAALQQAGLDGFILPRGDEHLGEYVAAGSERLSWLTGFTGSAGLAIVLPDRAAIFSDGRYVLQLAAQTDAALWQRQHVTESPPENWLASQLEGSNARIGYDPWLMSQETLARYNKTGITLVATSPNPVDGIWRDRPPPPLEPVRPQPLDHAGVPAADKRREIAALLREHREDAVMLTDPASINWLLNIRGQDVPFTPLGLGFALLGADEQLILFMDSRKLSDATRQWLGNAVQIEPPEALATVLAGLGGQAVRLDPAGSAAWFAQRLQEAGARISPGADPCLLPKARKNKAEQDGARAAHQRDGVALCRFLHWLDGHAAGTSESEAAARLDNFRAASALYRGESFPAISGSGPNGAVIHYRVTPETDRRLGADEIYLIDSGGQYADSTTDVTRTIWTGPGQPTAEMRDHYTRVLRGHIAIAAACFPAGIPGTRLDSLARSALWQAGLDYDHGTGHGVGSFLSVHEGPCGIHPRAQAVPIEAGMILSDEPGCYQAGRYGMRVENLLLVQPAAFPQAAKPFLRFETLTLAPLERRLIEPGQLSGLEREWIDAYHARVQAEIGPVLRRSYPEDGAAAWLERVCAPLSAV